MPGVNQRRTWKESQGRQGPTDVSLFVVRVDHVGSQRFEPAAKAEDAARDRGVGTPDALDRHTGVFESRRDWPETLETDDVELETTADLPCEIGNDHFETADLERNHEVHHSNRSVRHGETCERRERSSGQPGSPGSFPRAGANAGEPLPEASEERRVHAGEHRRETQQPNGRTRARHDGAGRGEKVKERLGAQGNGIRPVVNERDVQRDRAGQQERAQPSQQLVRGEGEGNPAMGRRQQRPEHPQALETSGTDAFSAPELAAEVGRGLLMGDDGLVVDELAA